MMFIAAAAVPPERIPRSSPRTSATIVALRDRPSLRPGTSAPPGRRCAASASEPQLWMHSDRQCIAQLPPPAHRRCWLSLKLRAATRYSRGRYRAGPRQFHAAPPLGWYVEYNSACGVQVS